MEEEERESIPSSEEPQGKEGTVPQEKGKLPSKGKWFKKIPMDLLFTPGGVVLLFFAGLMELLDLIPGGALIWEWIPEIFFMILLAFIAKIPFQSMLIPFIIERIPVVSDIAPTWLLRIIL
jgi:hypothetical protein